MFEMVATPPFAEIAAHVAIDLRGTPASELDSGGTIDAVAAGHVVGRPAHLRHRAMGRVVDAECRVLGVDGPAGDRRLVFPEVPRANAGLMVLGARRSDVGPPPARPRRVRIR